MQNRSKGVQGADHRERLLAERINRDKLATESRGVQIMCWNDAACRQVQVQAGAVQAREEADVVQVQ